MITVYAEKPSVARKIVSAIAEGKSTSKEGYIEITYKGEPCYVTWGVGHLCELKQAVDYNPDYKQWRNLPMPFVPEKFETKVKPEVRAQAKIVHELFKKSSLIINATDYDREGELIFYYLMTTLKCKVPFKRLCLKSLEISAIKDAFEHLASPADVKDLTDAARARSIADFLVGSNATVAMTLGYSGKDVLSVGRVQTPTLNILVQREKEILAFDKRKYFDITGTFTTKDGKKTKYTGAWDGDRIFDSKEAAAVLDKLKTADAVIDSVEKTVSDKLPPYLYNLSSLQMDANSIYGFSLDKTLKIAQSLYEKGYTTYPRTDSMFLTKDMVGEIKKVLTKLKGMSEYASFVTSTDIKNFGHWFDDSKVSSHTAIIPTTSTASGLSPDEQKIYDLVCRSVICMIYDKAVIERVAVKTVADEYTFVSKGVTVKDKQWMAVSLSPTKETVLPPLEEKTAVDGEYKMEEKETQPPKRYTDKTLLSAMLNAGKALEDEELKKILTTGTAKGIGTEATRAGILNTLITRGYVERVKKNLVPTEKGIFLIDTIPIEDIKSAAYTAEWEKRLAMIADKKDTFDAFVADIIKQTTEWCNLLQEKAKTAPKAPAVSGGSASLTCPMCGKPVRKVSWGWGCSGYKEGCKFGVSAVIAGKKMTDAQVKALIEKGRTGEIKGFKSKAGKSFSAMLVLDKETGRANFEFAKK